ncbi:NAD(P)H-dependent oxidoreductase [Siphonobacter aquaeclarae]|jgi:modulator of drug activity B|uniref:Modulator of drug activity B n=1 Tax=Siphonobacter aquaeclarae TaxID=563176 RepID=A0A1G9HXR8_9BACT|nr:NAD(P)H-dependent oxidoreductase [Siphonobacter aquaeclarae]MBO9637169.1 NAD(P)H-dependent oxidoreductase [Siphonobacter aquaeclarae]SDL17770.1 modulator of drug activity B [Siphonobacter aquaeclarae]
MKKVFVINGGQHFAHSGGKFNHSLTEWTADYLRQLPDVEVKVTDINHPYDLAAEVEKFVWADVIIYHTPVWWFQVPNAFKKYIDEVFTEGHNKGIYHSDGRSRQNPAINYGTGGQLHGRKYMLTTSWNAPETAFTLPGEFFQEKSVDDGVMFGFHRMNAFTGMERLPGFHFHDLEKNGTEERINGYRDAYLHHLASLFQTEELVCH